jgi:hypothetical protein
VAALKIPPYKREAVKRNSALSDKKRAQERPLHLVERALRARFRLSFGVQKNVTDNFRPLSDLYRFVAAPFVKGEYSGVFDRKPLV